MSSTPLLPTLSNPAADRRSGPRRRFERLVYASFGADNGGILMDISASGSRFQSVEAMVAGELLSVSFLLTGSVAVIKAAAEVVWCNDSGKGGGLRFVDLPEAERSQIGSWVSSDPAPAILPDGNQWRENGRAKFNLLTAEGHHAPPEPTSDAAALEMARLLVSARGSAKLNPKPHEGFSSHNDRTSQSALPITPYPPPEALVAEEPTIAPVNEAEAPVQPDAALSFNSEAVVTPEASASAPVIGEPIAWRAPEPFAESADIIAAADTIAEDVALDEAIAATEMAVPLDLAVTAATISATSTLLPSLILDEPIEQLHGDAVEAILASLPEAAPPVAPVEAISPSANASADLPASIGAPTIASGPLVTPEVESVSANTVEPAEEFALPPKSKEVPPDRGRPPVSATHTHKHKKLKHVRRTSLVIPSLLNAAPTVLAKAEPLPVPHWGAQVLRFAVGVGTGCCLVAGTFVGLHLLGSGHRAFSAPSSAVEAAAPLAGQPLDVEVVDLNSRRWHLSDTAPENAFNAVPAGPQSPVVELTPADSAATAALTPSPVTAVPASRASAKQQQTKSQSRTSGSKLLALQRPRVTANTAASGELRAPSILAGIAPSLSSALAGPEAHAPAPVPTLAPAAPQPQISRPVFPSFADTAPARRSTNFQAATVIEQVNPVYPSDAKQQHLTGTIRLNAVIGKDGAPHSLKVISGDPRLASAALAAVSQWRYEPAQINGEAVESEATISVEFQLH